VVLAKEAATIDVLSGGRFELGLGSGWLREEYDQAGISFDAPGTRIERLTEAVAIVKGLLGDAPVTLAGRHYTITGLQGRPSPVQRPHPPLLIGGGGPRTLSLAAREASIVGLVPRARRDGGGLDRGDFGEAALREKIGWVREAAGDRFEALELHALIQAVIVSDQRSVAAEQVAARFGAGREVLLESPYLLIGSVDGICETLRQRREAYGISYLTVFDRDVEVFAPVVERLAGRVT
jgi:probable F420-dependent oxidoreductase